MLVRENSISRTPKTATSSVSFNDCPPLPSPITLKPCKYQVAGHLPENGKRGSLVDEHGRFYKPLQPGPRGTNELNFYGKVFSEEFLEVNDEDEEEWSRRVELRRFVPTFYGCISLATTADRPHLILQDVVYGYSKPCVMDVKIGYRTWYSSADERYNQRAKKKDSLTTQATIGFKICGWQVYDKIKRKFHRVSKSKCKTMSENQVHEALKKFADNKSGIGAMEVYSSCNGAISQLRELRNWFQNQGMFKFYSSSVLVTYDGDAECVEDLNVQIKLVDFAHTYPTEGTKDRNFQDGLISFMQWLEEVVDETKNSSKKSDD
eukprot:g6148.t1